MYGIAIYNNFWYTSLKMGKIKGVVMKISDYMNIKEAAKFLGVSCNTLRNWEAHNKIIVHRNPLNNYRLYKIEDLEKLLNDIISSREEILVFQTNKN
jgi:hypothetical protein